MRFHARRVIRNTAVILTILGVFKFQWWIGNEYPNSKPNNVFPKELTIFKNIKPTETKELPSRTSTIPTIKIIKKAKALLERKQNILILVYNQNGGVTKWVGALRDKCDVDMATREQCPLWKIELTYNKSRFAESDLVIFHALGGNMPNTDELRRLSKNRPLLQRWVYHSMESPKVTPMVSPLNGFFNATWTYRSDSDFSAAYATYVPLSPTEMSYKKVTISKRDYSKGKTSLVAWVVSNCSARLRNEFVAELMKYIDVHVYGSCSSHYNQTRVCNRGKMSKCLKKYKFYLSFENALCKDYITEKYWDRLGEEDVVPVVLGGADASDYSTVAIPGSYINVWDFKSVKELAEYLKYLDKKPAAYNKYFQWRSYYKRNTQHYPICNFCKSYALNHDLRSTKILDLDDFWVRQARCNKNDREIRKMISGKRW